MPTQTSREITGQSSVSSSLSAAPYVLPARAATPSAFAFSAPSSPQRGPQRAPSPVVNRLAPIPLSFATPAPPPARSSSTLTTRSSSMQHSGRKVPLAAGLLASLDVNPVPLTTPLRSYGGSDVRALSPSTSTSSRLVATSTLTSTLRPTHADSRLPDGATMVTTVTSPFALDKAPFRLSSFATDRSGHSSR